jgi:hypothetical protein
VNGETLAKLYLELAHVVPPGTRTFREIKLEELLHLAIRLAERLVDDPENITDDDRALLQRLRSAVGWSAL